MRILFALLYLVSIPLYGQSQHCDTMIYQLTKKGHKAMTFVSTYDTIHFEVVGNSKPSDRPVPFLNITNGREGKYHVMTYFSGFGYNISTVQDDSLRIIFRDLPYGELLINGLSGNDLVHKNLTVTINGVKGVPTLDITGKTLNTERVKKAPIREILITNNNGDKVFCSARRDESAKEFTYTLCLSNLNSSLLNDRLKLSTLFILWLYEK